jgi:uncharacterized spore protein YtfJ
MDASETLKKIGEIVHSAATVKSVFGEPIDAEGKTIVPVARVAYGFGAGGGAKHHSSSGDPAEGEGAGGGGGVRAFPAGALEITHNGTRFVRYTDFRWIGGAFAAGVVLGSVFGRRKH